MFVTELPQRPAAIRSRSRRPGIRARSKPVLGRPDSETSEAAGAGAAAGANEAAEPPAHPYAELVDVPLVTPQRRCQYVPAISSPAPGPAAASPIRPAVTCGVAHLVIMVVGVPLGTFRRTQQDTHDRPRPPGPPRSRLPGTTRPARPGRKHASPLRPASRGAECSGDDDPLLVGAECSGDDDPLLVGAECSGDDDPLLVGAECSGDDDPLLVTGHPRATSCTHGVRRASVTDEARRVPRAATAQGMRRGG
jgi:hypothetical protein